MRLAKGRQTELKFVKDFAFGAFYLVSCVYSFGFSITLTNLVRPVSGYTAYIPVPDGLFSYEVLAFAVFGVVFAAASVYHFRMSLRSVQSKPTGFGRASLVN
jgi:hypothetical protein